MFCCNQSSFPQPDRSCKIEGFNSNPQLWVRKRESYAASLYILPQVLQSKRGWMWTIGCEVTNLYYKTDIERPPSKNTTPVSACPSSLTLCVPGRTPMLPGGSRQDWKSILHPSDWLTFQTVYPLKLINPYLRVSWNIIYNITQTECHLHPEVLQTHRLKQNLNFNTALDWH